jgi:aldehyde dehydrogenase (NAD+)
MQEVLKKNQVPEGVFCLINGDAQVGKMMVEDHRIALVSATGSSRMGKAVGETVAARFGKSLLELGGNNAIIITPNADLKLAIPAVVFGAVGTCGQRCTSTRRIIIHDSMYDTVVNALKDAYSSLEKLIGDPRKEGTLIGPLIDTASVEAMKVSLQEVQAEGGKLRFGGNVLSGPG